MKQLVIVFALAVSMASAAEEEAADTKSVTKQSSPTTAETYETAEQIKTMTRCRATVEKRSPCSVRLRTSDGKLIYIGSPGATQEIAAFLLTLKNGPPYNLPDAFLDFQKARK